MKRSQLGTGGLIAGVLLASLAAPADADTGNNAYSAIVTRNPFALKPPPPPPDPNQSQPAPPPAALATVELTGITDILGNRRALLEIIPGPGKTMVRPILAEGEREGSVEVVAIDVAKNEVTIRNVGYVTNLTFKVAKSTPAPAAPATGLPGLPMPNRPALTPPVPQTSSYNEMPTSSGRSVVMAGAEAPLPPPNPGAGALSGTGFQPTGVNPGVNPGINPASGFRSIPSRSIRTGAGLPPVPGAPGQTAEPQMSREEQIIHIEANRQLNPPNFPPLPPTPFSPQHDQ